MEAVGRTALSAGNKEGRAISAETKSMAPRDLLGRVESRRMFSSTITQHEDRCIQIDATERNRIVWMQGCRGPRCSNGRSRLDWLYGQSSIHRGHQSSWKNSVRFISSDFYTTSQIAPASPIPLIRIAAGGIFPAGDEAGLS